MDQVVRFSVFMRVGVALVLGCALLGSAARAYAFSEALTYVANPNTGGGGGRWFTGSPAEGYGCSVCHTGAPAQQAAPIHVEGIPTKGYAPGSVYTIRLSWPEFAARAAAERQAAANNPSAPLPAMGMIAEFLAENGTASGTITLDPAHIAPGEYCELPANRRGASVYHVKPAEMLADSAQRMSPCDANDLGTRCLVTVASCGAQEVRFQWTAPPSWQGPIWFSAGFVATDASTGDPTSDAVIEISDPLVPATSGAQDYESVLNSGCSATKLQPGAHSTSALALFCACALLVAVRVRARRVFRSRALWIAIALFGSACSEAHEMPVYPKTSPNAGLYAPGSQIGVVRSMKDAGTDAGKLGMAMGDRCVGAPGDGMQGDEGQLTVDFTSTTLNQKWGPANCGAVWIEDENGTYIATMEMWAKERIMSLNWLDHLCQKTWPEPDAVTQATLPNHTKPHSSLWKSRDFRRKLAPDGKYYVFIEVTELEYSGKIKMFEFTKGPEGFTMTPPDDSPFKGLKIVYKPNAALGGGASGAGGASGSGVAGAAGMKGASGSASTAAAAMTPGAGMP